MILPTTLRDPSTCDGIDAEVMGAAAAKANTHDAATIAFATVRFEAWRYDVIIVREHAGFGQQIQPATLDAMVQGIVKGSSYTGKATSKAITKANGIPVAGWTSFARSPSRRWRRSRSSRRSPRRTCSGMSRAASWWPLRSRWGSRSS